MKIQAALITAPQQPIRVETLDLDPPRAGEVLVQIKACGVCHSDYHLITGATKHPLPVVPGHEGAGIVEAVGDSVTHIQPGDHVVLNWAPNCGHWFYLRGKPNLCDTFVGPIWDGVMLDGTPRLKWQGQPVYHFSALAAFAEFAVVPQETCVVVRRDVPLSVAALVGCAVTTGVGAPAMCRQGSGGGVWLRRRGVERDHGRAVGRRAADHRHRSPAAKIGNGETVRRDRCDRFKPGGCG
jgi:Zn-dependent alcohol dehydrogenase